jgi:hypothetical protein
MNDNIEEINNKKVEIITYEKEKIDLIFNILNQVQFQGIQQAQVIAQISVILSNPIHVDIQSENIQDENNK